MIIIHTPNEFAHAVNRECGLGLTPRPYQFQAPHDSLWWLIPSTDWPAHRFGKLIFSAAKDHPRRTFLRANHPAIEVDTIFAGLHIERGYGSVATFVDPRLRGRPQQIADGTWLWHRLTDPKGATRFARVLAAAAEMSKSSLYLYLTSSYAHDREVLQHVEHDGAMFVCHMDGIQVVQTVFPIGSLQGVQRATTFVDLAETLRGIDGYHWVDLCVGHHVPKGNVDVPGLCKQLLSKFDAWIVE